MYQIEHGILLRELVMPKKIDLTGKRFGRWKVLEEVTERRKRSNGRSRIYWLCQCDCGTIKKVLSSNLKVNKSCGCLQREVVGNLNRTHGQYQSKTYKVWEGIKQRCLNPNSKGFHNWGGRGITICEEWMDFVNFFRDMGEQPEGYDIHRIDNNKGYYPDNCEWKERSKHRRDHSYLNEKI
jgi:hypothetical protein